MFDGALTKLFERCKQASLTSNLTSQLATLELFASSQSLAKVCESVCGCACVWCVCVRVGVGGYIQMFMSNWKNIYFNA